MRKVKPDLALLFKAWQDEQVDNVSRHSVTPGDFGIQGIAALCLGDLYGRLQKRNPQAAERALARLGEMFRAADTPQSVRWPLADALSLINMDVVKERVVDPVMSSFFGQAGPQLAHPDKIRKTLAYMIGLLRLSESRARAFLLQECLGLEHGESLCDWSTWSTAIVALGRTANTSDIAVLVEIAGGKRLGIDLQQLFPDEKQRNYIRREAMNALAEMGTLEIFEGKIGQQLATDPSLIHTYYETMQQIYWRQGFRPAPVSSIASADSTGSRA